MHSCKVAFARHGHMACKVLFVFCCLYGVCAFRMVLFVWCSLCSVVWMVLFVLGGMYCAVCIVVLVWCYLYDVISLMLLVWCCLYCVACIVLFVWCFLYCVFVLCYWYCVICIVTNNIEYTLQYTISTISIVSRNPTFPRTQKLATPQNYSKVVLHDCKIANLLYILNSQPVCMISTLKCVCESVICFAQTYEQLQEY